MNYTYNMPKEVIIDQYVTNVNVPFFTGAEIELANCKNEIFEDLKADNINVGQLRKNDVPFWSWVRTYFKDTGERTVIHLLTFKNINIKDSTPSSPYSRLTKQSSGSQMSSSNSQTLESQASNATSSSSNYSKFQPSLPSIGGSSKTNNPSTQNSVDGNSRFISKIDALRLAQQIANSSNDLKS